MVRHIGRPDRAEKDSVEFLELVEPAGRNVGASADVALGAPVEVLKFEGKALDRRKLLQNLDAGRNDLVTDAVAGNRRDPVRLQAGTLDCALIASATEDPTSAVFALPFM